MQVGMVADITIFDPKNVTDNATYLKGTLPTTGIPHVIVNGTVVVKDSKVLPDAYPGQPIRFPVESKGRYEPVDPATWRSRFLVPPSGFDGFDECITGSLSQTPAPGGG